MMRSTHILSFIISFSSASSSSSSNSKRVSLSQRQSMGTNTAFHSSSLIRLQLKRSSLLRPSLQDNHPPSHSLSFLTKPTTTALAASANGITANNSATLSANSPSTALLADLLEAGNFRDADDETRRLLIVLAGDAAQKRGYVFFSEVQYIPEAELRAIDLLWLHHSSGKFGYSVQKRIFLSQGKANSDFTRFFIRVGWMKKLDCDTNEADHYNYKSFPAEFFWEITDDVPDGHLPLTNALRGTQLLNSIFAHSAFDQVLADDEPQVHTLPTNANATKATSTPTPLFKTNYSF